MRTASTRTASSPLCLRSPCTLIPTERFVSKLFRRLASQILQNHTRISARSQSAWWQVAVCLRGVVHMVVAVSLSHAGVNAACALCPAFTREHSGSCLLMCSSFTVYSNRADYVAWMESIMPTPAGNPKKPNSRFWSTKFPFSLCWPHPHLYCAHIACLAE